MTRHTGGTRRSSWLAFQRRLLIVRLLMRGGASRKELVAAVCAALGNDAYPTNVSSAFKHDLDALKFEYGCRIIYHRQQECYVLEYLGDLALLDMPDECLDALWFLETSFPATSELPEHLSIRALIERILLLLPADRKDAYMRKPGTISFQPEGNTSGRVDPHMVGTIKRAIEHRRELEFEYLSTFDDDMPRRHRVAPYAIFFRPEGHGYLDATLLDVVPRKGETIHASIDYRLSRILSQSVTILPNILPPQRPQPPTYRLCYRLLPVVARRRDVASYFPNTHITYHDDGSATVTATVTNLWQTRYVLLRYGTACQVLEPPELVRMFYETAQGLTDLYDSAGEEEWV